MRLLHTSDWHLGRTLFQTSLHDAHAQFLTWLLELAQAEEVDAVLVSGDVYDRAVPPTESVRLLDDTFLAFAEARVPLVLVSGNHDNAVRLGFGGRLASVSGIHLRTGVATLDEPVVLSDEHGPVGIYGIPYLLPDAVRDELGAGRSHESVLTAATERILAHAADQAMARTVVLSHAFVTGGAALTATADSERDIRVGGIGDAPARVFDGLTYVALGHLHRPQEITLAGSTTRLAYSGSPIPFSFSEKDDTKSVTLVELGADGVTGLTRIPTPVSRALVEATGSLADLLARAETDLAHYADCFVKAVITDSRRPEAPMERLRAHWPHTLVLEFRPDVERPSTEADLIRLSRASDPAEVLESFVSFIEGSDPTLEDVGVLRSALECVRDTAASA